jgi:hypothetical protein
MKVKVLTAKVTKAEEKVVEGVSGELATLLEKIGRQVQRNARYQKRCAEALESLVKEDGWYIRRGGVGGGVGMEWVGGVGGGAGGAPGRSGRRVGRGVGRGVRRVVRSRDGIGGREKKKENNISTCI